MPNVLHELPSAPDTPDKFTSFLHDPAMADMRKQMIEHTRKTGHESGHVAYKDGSLSELVVPDPESAFLAHGSPTVDLWPHMSGDTPHSFDPNLQFIVHTHPPLDRWPDGKAYPSTGDHSIHKRMSEEDPMRVGGILSWSKDIFTPSFSLRGLRMIARRRDQEKYATLFLERNNPAEFQRLHNDELFPMATSYGPGRETWENFQGAAGEEGVNYAQLLVDPHTGKIVDDSQLPHLFYSGDASMPRNERKI